MSERSVHSAQPCTGAGEPHASAEALRAHGTPHAHDDARQAAGSSRLRIGLAFAAVLVACALIVAAFTAMSSASRAQGAESVRQAVLSAAMQCCAVEGSYPSTLEHLEDHYGLSVNHNDYVIMYEAFASNVAPTVTVVPR